MSVPVGGDICGDEKALVSELRRLCTYLGVERKETLHESAQIFYEMGELYLNKTSKSEKMAQKLNFIKCFALFNGAKVRFRALNEEGNVADVDKDLEEAGRRLLEAATAVRMESLLDFSESVFKKIVKMRKRTQDIVDAIPKNDEEQEITFYGWPDLSDEDKNRVDLVQALYREVTEKYRRTMDEIARKCVHLLKSPPCKFAMVGLGSLAREEITPYSDFEHVIILEDGVEDDDNYEVTLEYFRWFAVLFQCIIINFGETFIPSVGVKSLNDSYSGDRTKNWYYDSFTPCGVSFDGMVPHSCNNPLGRQEATKARKHVVELIQPAWKMAKFLTRDEEIKNGYYLKDVLIRTCLVYGDSKLYQTFADHRSAILKKERIETMLYEYRDKLYKNVNRYMMVGTATSRGYEDIKQTAYRPITALLAYLGGLLNIFEPTSFAIIERLCEADVFSLFLARRMKYALAVILQARLKVYSLEGNQRHRITVKKLNELIGTWDAVQCFALTNYLRSYAIAVSNFESSATHYRVLPMCWMQALYNTRQYKRAISLAKDISDLPEATSLLGVYWIVGNSYIALASDTTDQEESRRLRIEAVKYLQLALSLAEYTHEKNACMEELAYCYALLQDESSLVEVRKQRRSLGVDGEDKFDFSEIKSAEIQAMKSDPELKILLHDLKTVLDTERNITKAYLLRLRIVEIQTKLGVNGHKEKLFDLVTELWSHKHQVVDAKLPAMFTDIVGIQCASMWLEDALHTIELVLHHYEGRELNQTSIMFCANSMEPAKLNDYTITQAFLESFECFKSSVLLSMKSYDSCISFIENGLKYDKLPHTETLSRCYLNKFMETTSKEDQIYLLEKLFQNCRLIPESPQYLDFYACGIVGLFHIGDLENIITHFQEAPSKVQHRVEVQTCIGTQYQRVLLNKGSPENALKELQLVLSAFSAIVVRHPLWYLRHARYRFLPFVLEDESLSQEMQGFEEQFFQEHRIRGRGFMVEDYNKALRNFARLNFPTAAAALWKVLILADIKSFVAKEARDLLILVLAAETRNLLWSDKPYFIVPREQLSC